MHRVVLEHYTTLDKVDELDIDEIDIMCIVADAWAAAAASENS